MCGVQCVTPATPTDLLRDQSDYGKASVPVSPESRVEAGTDVGVTFARCTHRAVVRAMAMAR